MVLMEQCFLTKFQSSVAFDKETSRFIFTANQMTGFYIKCKTGLEWVNIMLVYSFTAKIADFSRSNKV